MKNSWDRKFIVTSYFKMAADMGDDGHYLKSFGQFLEELFACKLPGSEYHVTTAHSALCIHRSYLDGEMVPRVTLKIEPQMADSQIHYKIEILNQQSGYLNILTHSHYVARENAVSVFDGILKEYDQLRDKQSDAATLAFI